jgi:hypothetical protein
MDEGSHRVANATRQDASVSRQDAARDGTLTGTDETSNIGRRRA